MMPFRAVWLFVVLIRMVAPADAASRNVDGLAGKLKAGATFCEGAYALCIKAACAPIASTDGTVDNALCSCEVVKGWSMGPASCSARMPVKKGSYTYLMSTYS